MADQNGKQQKQQGWRYGRWLALGLAISGVLIWAASWESDRQERISLESVRASLADLAQISESIISNRLQRYDTSLLVLREASIEDMQSFTHVLGLLRSGPLADPEILVVVVDREGYLAYTDTPHVASRLYLGDRAYFRFFADGGTDRLYIDEPTFGRVTKRHTLPLVRPIYDREGRFAGVVAVSVPQSKLGELSSRLELSSDTTLTVINTGGAVVTRSRDLEKMQGTKLTRDQLAPMLEGEAGTFQRESWLAENGHMIAYRQVQYQNSPLILFIDVSVSAMLRSAKTQRLVLLAAAAFTSLVIFALLLVNQQRRRMTDKYIEAQRQQVVLESEKRHRTILHAAMDGFWVTDLQGRLLEVNEAYCRMSGYSEQELLAMAIPDLEAAESADDTGRHIQRVMGKGQERFETQHRRKDGSKFDVEVSAQYSPFKEGQLVVFLRDLSKQKKTAKALLESEERFRLLFEQAPIPYQSLDYDGYFLAVNSTWLETLGYAREEVLGRSFGDFLLPEKKEHFKYNFPRFKDKGEILGVEFEMVKKDGTVILARFNGKIGRDGNGKFKQTHCVFQDITEARKAEYERALNEERLQALLQLHEKRTLQEKDLLDYVLEEGVRLTESQCGYLHFVEDDENSLSLHAWSKETLKICQAEKTPHYSLASAGIWADCVRERKPVIHNDYPNTPGKKGYPAGHFPLQRHMSVPIFDGDKIVAIIGVGNKKDPYVDADKRQLQLFFASTWDIIRQKRFELERVQVTAQLQQAQKMEAIGTLAGGIAHDFNNILSAIFGYTEMAQEDAPPGSRFTKDLDNVLVAASRAKDLVRQILAFSRQASIERAPMKIQSLIREGLKMLRSSIPTTISITENIDPEAGTLLADPTQIHQILMNLCTNAYHAMEETGGVLAVSLKKSWISGKDEKSSLSLVAGEYVELTVSDTGSGIGPDIIDKVFDPYFTTKETGRGTGMGLAIIHGIIAEYGGAITVESRLGQGTSFHVYLPVVGDEELPAAAEQEEVPTGKEQILFVDDEELLAEMGHDMLVRLGYGVTVRRSSYEALETFQNTPQAFDLVITDQTMPGMTGSDLARRLMQIRPDIPIILCTGYSNLIDESSAQALGIKEFALKPLAKAKLAQLIRKVLDAA